MRNRLGIDHHTPDHLANLSDKFRAINKKNLMKQAADSSVCCRTQGTRVYLPDDDIYVDMGDFDAIAQASLVALQTEARNNAKLFAICRVETSIGSKKFVSTYEAKGWESYSKSLGSQQDVDPINRQVIDGFKAYLYSDRTATFRKVYDNFQENTHSWNFNLYRIILSDLSDKPYLKLLFMGILSAIIPCLQTSLYIKSGINNLTNEGESIDRLATEALADASYANIVEPIPFLLRHGADANGTDASRGRPLINAIGNNNNRIVRIILQHYATADIEDGTTSKSAMHCWSQLGDYKILMSLLTARDRYNATDELLLNAMELYKTNYIEGAREKVNMMTLSSLKRPPVRNEGFFKEILYDHVGALTRSFF